MNSIFQNLIICLLHFSSFCLNGLIHLELWVLYVGDESLNSTPETNIALSVN